MRSFYVTELWGENTGNVASGRTIVAQGARCLTRECTSIKKEAGPLGILGNVAF